MKLYGLKNCDSCRKASQWLTEADIAFEFVDIRADGNAAARLDHWIAASDWQTLLNTRSRTWRELPKAKRDALDGESAKALMAAQPTLIKRPVLEHADGVTAGFSASNYAALLTDAG